MSIIQTILSSFSVDFDRLDHLLYRLRANKLMLTAIAQFPRNYNVKNTRTSFLHYGTSVNTQLATRLEFVVIIILLTFSQWQWIVNTG